jgi:hypothetical protein
MMPMNEWFALSIIDQVHNLQPRFMGCETHPHPLVSKFFCGKIVLCAKKALFVSMIDSLEIHHKVSKYFLSARAKPCALVLQDTWVGPSTLIKR